MAVGWDNDMNDNKQDDFAYYLSRADQEDEAARKAENPLAAAMHRCLASRYRALVGGPEYRPALRLARD